LVERLGFARGVDGAFADVTGQKLVVDIQTTAAYDIQLKSTLALADNWQRIGVGTNQEVLPPQRVGDREYRATRRGYTLLYQVGSVRQLANFHGSQTPLPENNYVGNNRTRFMSPDFDSLLDRYFVTIPRTERAGVLREIVHYSTDLALRIDLFYYLETTMVHNRMGNVGPDPTWNAHQWEVA
ncbi:MAG: bac 5 protein, partial [Chloroflexi bacterium]|nr:bac 5 protein [Chloroflexota bacterium]